ncbi:MAG: riboflavin synthase [Candidatus Krumholzibacteriia bacterium]
MFTGLIREIGTLRSVSPRAGVLRLVIAAPRTSATLGVGDSIAVGGICLTAVAVGRGAFTVEAAAETRRLTTLGAWRPGRRLHLEPALRLGDALDGHLVQGHVDGVGTVRSLRKAGGGWHLTVAYPGDLGRFLTPKGSVAVDGVSLTVDEGPFTGSFTANLIPHTMEQTTFAGLKPGDQVNLEMDVLVKAARQPAASGRPGLTLDRLFAAGFGRTGRRGPA